MVNEARFEVDLLLAEAAMVLSRFRRQIPECVQQELGQESVTRVLAASTVLVPSAFVRRVARNLAIDWLRRQRQYRISEDVELLSTNEWQHQVEERLDLERVRLVLSTAPAPYRDLLEGLVYEDLDMEAIVAEEVLERGRQADDAIGWGLARDAVYKRRNRALAWLRRQLGNE